MAEKKEPYGSVSYADPGYREDTKRYPLDTEAHVRAALSYFSMPKNAAKYTPEQRKAIMGRIKAACKRFGIEVSDGSDHDDGKRAMDPATVGVETRSASVDGVDFGQRIVTLLAVPYEQATEVVYRQEVWSEIFTRTAFEGIETRNRRIPANREHKPEWLVGKVVGTQPGGEDGLVVDIRVSRTERGDETLELARDEVLSASAGFMVKEPHRDQMLDRRNMTRRVNRAFLDHVAFVGAPAYEGAKVLAMRTPQETSEADLSPLITPGLDDFFNDPLMRWVATRVK